MHGTMLRVGGLLASALALAALGGLGPAVTLAQEPEPERPSLAERAGRLFGMACARCHVYPDPALPTDRAWLAQLMETS